MKEDSELFYGVTDTPFGKSIIVAYCNTIAAWSFNTDSLDPIFSSATRCDKIAQDIANKYFADKELDFTLIGTKFQIKAWVGLIHTHSLISYSQLAENIGEPRAVRAVGTAIGRNRIAIAVPCHRIIRANGEIGNYFWGSEKKREIIDWEKANEKLR